MAKTNGKMTWLKDKNNAIIVPKTLTEAIQDREGKTLDEILGEQTDSVLTEDLTATVEIGTITSGKKYPAGTSIETILRNMLIKVEKPTVSLSLTPATTLYDAVTGKIESIVLTAKITKKTYDVAKLTFMVGDTVVNTKTEVKDGGTFTFTYKPSTPITKNTTFSAKVEDVKAGTNTSSVSVVFIAKSYYGIVAKDIGEPTEAQIKSLDSTLKNSKGYVYNNIVCEFNKVVYAYPASLGALTNIKDVPNNLNYTASFTRTSLKIDGIDYYCYTLTEPTGADGVQLTFA